jgi:3-phenylpropionate/cinnamic acid dioxygenase small subunit
MAITGTIEDREEIRELYARYCVTLDSGRYDEWIACFTEDGVCETLRFGRHAGPDGLKKFAALYKESLGGARVLHVVTNLTLDLNGSDGAGICYLLYYHYKDGRIQQSTVAYYTDKLHKTGAGWRFANRQLTILGHN